MSDKDVYKTIQKALLKGGRANSATKNLNKKFTKTRKIIIPVNK